MPGVPNTTDFSLADVIAAVLPSSNDLDECFTDAIQGAFNYTYNPGGNQNTNLLNFRDYGNDTAAQNQVYITPDEFNPTGACSTSRTVLAWKNNNPNSVQNGDKFWEDDNGSPGDPYPGGGAFQFFGAFTGLNSASFKLSSLGIASNVTFCSLPSLVLSDVYYFPSGSSTPTTPVDYYYSSTIGNASNLSVGDIIYTDAALTTPLNYVSSYYLQNGSSATTTHCTTSFVAVMSISGVSGVIKEIGCDSP
jgi:hypothetical protein